MDVDRPALGREHLQAPPGEQEPPLGALVRVGDGTDPYRPLGERQLPRQPVGDVALDLHDPPCRKIGMRMSGRVAVDAAVLASAVGVEGVIHLGEPGRGQCAGAIHHLEGPVPLEPLPGELPQCGVGNSPRSSSARANPSSHRNWRSIRPCGCPSSSPPDPEQHPASRNGWVPSSAPRGRSP